MAQPRYRMPGTLGICVVDSTGSCLDYGHVALPSMSRTALALVRTLSTRSTYRKIINYDQLLTQFRSRDAVSPADQGTNRLQRDPTHHSRLATALSRSTVANHSADSRRERGSAQRPAMVGRRPWRWRGIGQPRRHVPPGPSRRTRPPISPAIRRTLATPRGGGDRHTALSQKSGTSLGVLYTAELFQ